ncbi:hypothetical protein SEVIR_5G282901v4 [Setaria viridis]|uniref:PR5-like receptor kinase n=1 Tax=Setaria viridis TaxID=4556 RepID=UPI001493A361|nr:PR5-like receptor kinase [Setaria viridis]
MMPQSLLMRLLLLAAAASAATAAGDGCSTGCNLALGSYNIEPNQNLSYISSLLGIDDYRELPYNNPWFGNLDYIQAGQRLTVSFRCQCLALPTSPFSTYLAGSFPYRVSLGETYSSIAAQFNNLTTAAWLQATNRYPSSNIPDGGIMNVTINCSCGYPGVPPEYKVFLTYPLRDGETFDSVEEKYSFPVQSEMDSSIVYIPLTWSSAIVAPPSDSPSTGPSRSKTLIIASASSVFGVSIVLISLFLWYKKYYGLIPWQRGSSNASRIESFLQKQGTSHPKRYSYSEVRRMTTSFAHKLGQGGYGDVYRGNLPDGREIAVKMLKGTEGDGEEFLNEVASISRTSHVNIVTLLGFCLQGSKRALLYEYMPNGSLERYTFGSNSTEGEDTLSWDKLFDIVIGIARGLEYLHTGCNTRIVHFDIKPQNILLDQEFCPKISDFGLAKLCRQKESKISIGGMRGTIGYIAPEVFSRNYGAVSSKSDVYSYGMVILEMVGARKQINVSTDNSSMYFPQWLYDNFDQFCGATACEISSGTTELVRKMIIVGLWCIQFIPADRPSMSKVLEMLESNTMDLQLPPKAF